MMRMSSQVEYGLRAMLDIAIHGSGNPVQARDIHQRQQIDEHFISQILLMLRRAGLIESLRGRQGGHRLARSPEQITLLEIIEAVEGCDDSHERPLNSAVVDASVVRDMWQVAREQARQKLVSATLADLRDQRNLLNANSYMI